MKYVSTALFFPTALLLALAWRFEVRWALFFLVPLVFMFYAWWWNDARNAVCEWLAWRSIKK